MSLYTAVPAHHWSSKQPYGSGREKSKHRKRQPKMESSATYFWRHQRRLTGFPYRQKLEERTIWTQSTKTHDVSFQFRFLSHDSKYLIIFLSRWVATFFKTFL